VASSDASHIRIGEVAVEKLPIEDRVVQTCFVKNAVEEFPTKITIANKFNKLTVVARPNKLTISQYGTRKIHMPNGHLMERSVNADASKVAMALVGDTKRAAAFIGT